MVFWLIFLSTFFIPAWDGGCSEICTIGGNRVLLYKVINFWYDCLPGESEQLCEAQLYCRSDGTVRVVFDEAASQVTFRIGAGFLRLLSVAAPCGAEARGPCLKCSWLNPDYFGKGRAAAEPGNPGGGVFKMAGVGRKHALRISEAAGDLHMVISGAVQGLLDGRISLCRGEGFIKGCPEGGDGVPATVKLVRGETGEVLAVYSVAPGH